jgi:hypothetical protein
MRVQSVVLAAAAVVAASTLTAFAARGNPSPPTASAQAATAQLSYLKNGALSFTPIFSVNLGHGGSMYSVSITGKSVGNLAPRCVLSTSNGAVAAQLFEQINNNLVPSGGRTLTVNCTDTSSVANVPNADYKVNLDAGHGFDMDIH